MKSLKVKTEEILFERLSEEWLLYKKREIKESTYMNYNYKIEKYLKDYFGDKNIDFLILYDFNIFKEYLIIEKKLESKTIKDILLVLKSILKLAEKKYDVKFKLDLLSMPKSRKKEMKVLNSKERKKLKNYCLESHNLKEVGILICIYTGLRVGEICGLRWNDIDFSKRTISIKRTLQRVYFGKNTTKILIDIPKTENSIRVIPLCKVLYEKLKEIKPAAAKDSYILTGKTDKYVEPRNYQYTFGKCLQKCEITHYNFHALRHTFATDCIQVGMDVKSLSEILGHSDVSVTLNRYVHSSNKIKKKYMERL